MQRIEMRRIDRKNCAVGGFRLAQTAGLMMLEAHGKHCRKVSAGGNGHLLKLPQLARRWPE
jgi:hypothetical protein